MGHEVPEIEGVGSGPTPASRTLEDRLRDIGEGLDSAGHGLLDRDHGRLEALSMFPCSRRSRVPSTARGRPHLITAAAPQCLAERAEPTLRRCRRRQGTGNKGTLWHFQVHEDQVHF